MCGIAGFSLSPKSKINARKLAHELLCSIEDRGYMASGYAYQADGEMGVFKNAVTGSKLSLKKMPKRLNNVILHTRLATHGSTTDNRNNHPVMSPSGNVALVHNGVIYNHNSVRAQFTEKLADVDTSVIPALIAKGGVSMLNNLDGDAAIAWFSADQDNTLHVARYQHSPLVMCQVEDGSFIFCSTEQLLWAALIKLDITPVWMYTAPELEYLTVSNGVITSKSTLPEPSYSGSKYDYAYYRHQTAGAKSTASKPAEISYNSNWGSWYDEDGVMHNSDSDVIAMAKDIDNDIWIEVKVVDEPRWWTVVEDTWVEDTTYYSYDYSESEREKWEVDLWELAQTPGYVLFDYGSTDADGNSISLFNELF